MQQTTCLLNTFQLLFMALFLKSPIQIYQHMSREQLDTLFKQYENSFDKMDIKTLSGFCADPFMSAGPAGMVTQSKKEFEAKADKFVRFYRSVGRNSAKIISKRIIPISECYSMVVVRWGVTFEKTGSRPVEFDITYIVQQTEEYPKIILLISHEDEIVVLKKNGLRPQL
jgi:hypothetical protein